MIPFPKKISENLEILQYLYSLRNGTVEINYPIIEIRRHFINREISIKLFYDYNTDSFEIQAPTYKYLSKISHYDFKQIERRWCRDKDVLFNLIKNLQHCNLWDKVSNKDFITVNANNERVDSIKRAKLLEVIETPSLKKL